ncbi:hypothetical protein [Bacillus bingmayongensis]|uniref:hypothetical protein n=1 Tax=Bacillus bingmayongensis TaxID=1150157 RepID=UPI001ED9C324|nr:hypothetical protein [Bacillus bingmayongensis]
MAIETKADFHSFAHFILTWHGAGKGHDRFSAGPDALSHLKRKVLCRFFNLSLYIHIVPKKAENRKNKSDPLLFFCLTIMIFIHPKNTGL